MESVETSTVSCKYCFCFSQSRLTIRNFCTSFFVISCHGLKVRMASFNSSLEFEMRSELEKSIFEVFVHENETPYQQVALILFHLTKILSFGLFPVTFTHAFQPSKNILLPIFSSANLKLSTIATHLSYSAGLLLIAVLHASLFKLSM